MILNLLVADNRSHVALDVVGEFEAAILASGGVKTVKNRFARFPRVLGRALRTPSVMGMLGRLPGIGARYFSVLMAPDFIKCTPHFFASRNNAVYMFDVWPSVHSRVEDLLPKLNITTVFFSSLQVTESFQRKAGMECRFLWVPEGIDPGEYRSRTPGERDIDVLQFGRRYERYHDGIAGRLKEAGRSYLFEEAKGKIVFPSRREFVDGLSRSKISICIPGNITHPDRSGDVSTMTVRYLQSMASGCLVVGVLPYDMQFLFDYNPIVEIDFADPAGQILGILNDMEKYRGLIERNERNVRKNHTWARRWAEIRRRLETPGR
jgi:hypothetical protein